MRVAAPVCPGRAGSPLGLVEVQVVDDDLGRSGGGINRPGFERLLGPFARVGFGAVLAVGGLATGP